MFHDPYAAERFSGLVAQFKPGTLVETGTNKAHGTLHMARHRVPVFTVEINPESRAESLGNIIKDGFALEYLRGPFDEVKLTKGAEVIHSFLGDSPDVLATCLLGFAEPFIFYLDAHWLEKWPLLDECKVIASLGLSDSIIVIHDCQVPGKDWGYDAYNGQALNYEYVKDALAAINPHFKISYNEQACGGPSGRGILYAIPPSR